MATMEQLLEALKNADAAGDEEAARQFASIINSARSPAAPELPAPEEEPLGFMGLLTEGAKRAIAATKLIGAAATGDTSEQAQNVTEALESYQLPVPPQLEEAKTAFEEEAQMIREAPNWYSPGALKGAALGVLELGKQVVTNPKGVAYMTAEQAANMAPGILGNLAGYAAAAASGVGTVPALIMAAGAGFAGQTPIESGSELIGLIGEELSKRKLELNEKNVQSLLTDKEFMDEAVKLALIKGATTAAVDSVTTVGAARLATAPGRAAVKEAKAALAASGVAADDAAISAAAKTILANRTLTQKALTGAKVVGLGVAGGAASEAAGQQAAYGQINPEDVFQEALGEIGGTVIEVPALAKAMGEKVLRTPAAPPAPPVAPPTPPSVGGPTPTGSTPPPTRTAADFGLTEDELKNYISTIDRSIFGIDSQLTNITTELNRTDLTGAEIRTLQDDRRRLQHSRSELKRQRDYYAPPLPKPRKGGAGSFVSLDQARQVILAAGNETNPGDWSKALEAAFPQLAGKDKGRARGIVLSNLKKAGHISGQVKGKRTIIPGGHWNQPIVEPTRIGPKPPPASIAGIDLTATPVTPPTTATTPPVTPPVTPPTTATTPPVTPKFTGPVSFEEYEALSPKDKRRYVNEVGMPPPPTTATTPPVTPPVTPPTTATTPVAPKFTGPVSFEEYEALSPKDKRRYVNEVGMPPPPPSAFIEEESDVTYEPQEDKLIDKGVTYTVPWMRATYKDGTVIDASDGKAGITLSAPRTIGQFTFDTVYAEPDRVTLKGKTLKGKKYKIDIESDNIDILSENGSKLLTRFNFGQRESEDQIRKGLGDAVADAILGGKDPRSLVLQDLEGKINGALDAHYKATGRGGAQTQETPVVETPVVETPVVETPTEETPVEEATPAPSNYERALEYVNQPSAKITFSGIKDSLNVSNAEARQLINQLREANVIETKGSKNVLRSAEPVSGGVESGTPVSGKRRTLTRAGTVGEPVPGGVGDVGTVTNQPAVGEEVLPGTLKKKSKKELKAEAKQAQETAERKTPFIPDANDREVYSDAIINLRNVGAIPVEDANVLLVRLANDGDINSPSMTEKTYEEMITAINKAVKIARQSAKPEAKTTEQTPTEKRDAANKAWLDSTTEFEKSLDRRQTAEWRKSDDISRLKLNPAQGKLYERMEKLKDEFDKLIGDFKVETPNGVYTVNQKLQQFLENGPVSTQAGPAGVAAQREAVGAVDAIQDTNTQVGLELSRDYAARQRANLVGQRITNPEDLAVLAQVYRDPRFETLRAIFVDADGKVVAQVGITSRLPTSAAAIIGSDTDSYIQRLLSTAKNAGATGYYLLHNHPSGKAEPSRADQYMTAEYAARSQDVEFRGHVVIDTNEYSVIDSRGNFNFFYKDFGQPAPYTAAEWAGLTLNSPQAVIEATKKIQVDSDAVTLIHTDNYYNVKGVSTIPFNAASDTTLLRKQMLRGSRAVQAAHVFAVSRNMDALNKIKNFVIDAVHIDSTGLVKSLRMSGTIRGGELYPSYAGRRVRLSPDTSPQFDYLRENRFNKPPTKSGVAAPRSRYQTGRRLPAPRRRANTFQETVEQATKDLEALQTSRITWPQRFRALLPTNEKYNELVRKLQNDRRVLKQLQYGLELTGYLLYENSARLGRGFNNFYDRIINSSGKTALIFASRFSPDLKNLENMIRDLAKSKNVSVNEINATLDVILKTQHYDERRRSLHMLYSPLSDKKDITITLSDGSTTVVSAAELRSKILEEVRSNKKFTDQQLDSFRDTLEALTDINNPNNRLDPNGISQAENPGEPISVREIKKFSVDVNDPMYSPGPAEPAEIAAAQTYYSANKAALDPILDLVRKKIINETKKADKEAYFWTQGVDNLTRLYGWQNYVPLKGTIRRGDKNIRVFSRLNDAIEPRSKIVSPQFNNDIPQGIVGRGPDSEPMNVILQVQIDAVKAAIRAGQQDSREALRNAIKQGIIKDNPKLRVVVPFEEKYKGFDQIKYQNNEWFVYYRPDGALEFYKLTDPRQRDAIRRSYAADPLTGAWKTISTVNTFISKNFTRWNLSFAPKDFVRNVFFAAGIFGMEMGPKKIAEFVLRTTSRIASGSMMKGWKMWKLHEAGNTAEMQRLSVTDPFYKSAYEYLSKGGAVTYVQQFAGEGRLTNVLENYTKKELDRKFGNAKDALNLFLDTWVQSFEMTVRTTAYDMYKQEALDKGVSDDAAQISAAARAKELTNFESIGAEAHKLRAMYSFFGASSTGAVRTLDAMRPLMIKDVSTLMDELPERIKSDPIALDKARKKILQQKKNISLTMLAGVAAGATLYVMARSMAGEDEYDRNLVATDKKDMWTRALRIPLSAFGIQDADDTDVLSIPWGFGWGAFNAFGAQLMAYVMGDQSTRQLVGNTLQIGLDSFVPLPISRINPFDPASKLDPGWMSVAWVVDTGMPSSVRPAVEYLMNLNGLGQQLYGESRNSMSGAYQTSETVPEVYNAVAKGIEDATGGLIDWKPSTYYFLFNNYLSAIGGAASTSYGLYSWAMGNKDFVPSRDLPIVRSFFSRRNAPDAAEFAKVENLIRKRKYELDKLKNLEDSTRLDNYLEEHPYSETIIGLYNQYNAELNKVRELRNRIQNGKVTFDSPRERTEAVKYYNDELDHIRYSAVESLRDWMELEKDYR